MLSKHYVHDRTRKRPRVGRRPPTTTRLLQLLRTPRLRRGEAEAQREHQMRKGRLHQMVRLHRRRGGSPFHLACRRQPRWPLRLSHTQEGRPRPPVLMEVA